MPTRWVDTPQAGRLRPGDWWEPFGVGRLSGGEKVATKPDWASGKGPYYVRQVADTKRDNGEISKMCGRGEMGVSLLMRQVSG